MEANKIRKVIYLFVILLLPGVAYLFLWSGKHNFKKLPIIGPKQAVLNSEGKYDTVYHQIPYFEFTNQDGEKVTRDDLLGSVYIADFFFVNCPTICPKMATNMGYVQNKFENIKDLRFISITVNPEEDSVTVLKNYAEKVHANTDTWDFLTGKKEEIYDVALNGFFVSAQKDEVAPGGFLHSQYFILIDKKGRIRGLFDGTIHKVVKQELTDAIDILLKEEHLTLKGEKPKNLIEKH